ncbi:S49 family peptidase [uncultured Rikenella sp.]|uniref:S49 family peptidase n=1 Tax=uncultured Rikenella sp. TaxID=368003 RepID=UPI0026233370|nr:S49 family peptidase [uncultured Rikenella sp.]
MILNFNLLRSVLAEPFYLSNTEAEKLTALVAGLFTPNVEFERMTPEERAALASVHTIIPASGSGTTRRIGVITLRGVLSKYDSMCAAGMESYGRMIREYDADPEIDAIVLNIDSPGGTVAGTEELGATIRAATKPVVAFVNGMAASAAYWIASACRKIVAGTDTSIVGSIGVMCTWADMRGYYAQQGIVIRDIYAPQSTDKNAESREAAAGNLKPIQDHLAVLADTFQKTVRANRPLVAVGQLSGATYFAKDVVGTLVDTIGNFEEALSIAASFATPSAPKTKSTTRNMSKMNYAALAAAAGVAAFESADGSITLTAEQAAAVESHIGAFSAIKNQQEEVSKLQQELKEKDKQLAELREQLDNAPGAETASVSAPADGTKTDVAGAANFGEALSNAIEFVKSQN